jgi:hypothetical protein
MREFVLRSSLNGLEALESKHSLSSISLLGNARGSTRWVVATPCDDDPPPDPEPLPPVNPISGPVQYPNLPPSGPLGPG